MSAEIPDLCVHCSQAPARHGEQGACLAAGYYGNKYQPPTETPAPSDAEVEALAEWNRHDVIEMTACNSADKWIQCKCGERIRVDPVAWPDETWPPTQVEEDYLTMHALSAVLSVQMAAIAARHAAEVQAARADRAALRGVSAVLGDYAETARRQRGCSDTCGCTDCDMVADLYAVLNRADGEAKGTYPTPKETP